MRRILLISGSLPPRICGVGDYVYRLAAVLSRADLDVQVLTTAAPAETEAGFAVRPSVRGWRLSHLPETIREIRSVQPDIVHLQYPTAEYGARLLPQALSLSRAPFITTIHEASYSHILRRASLYPFLAFADRVVATTAFEADYMARMYPPVRSRLSVIPVGSNIPAAQTRSRNRSMIAYFGLVAPKKGLEDFLRLARLAGGAGERWTFQVIGSPPPKRETYAQRLRYGARSLAVDWLSYLPAEKVAQHLASAGAVYLPFPDGASLRRASLIAALLNGSPVVTTRGDATPNDLADGEQVIYAASPEAALKAIRTITSNPEVSERLSREAAAYAQRFSWTEIARRHVALYHSVLDGSLTTEA